MRWRDRLRAGALALLLLPACESSKIDGGELHGVFNSVRPVAMSSASGTASAAAPTVSAKASSVAAASAASAEVIAPLQRQPPAGSCLEPGGEAATTSERYGRRPACRGANVLEHRGADGEPRYACVFAPRGASERAPLPLIVFFHDEHDSPTAVHTKTYLRKHYSSFDLSGDQAHLGYVVLAPQARRLAGALRFDVGHLAADNADVVATERFIAELEQQGLIDTHRSYALGQGKGGTMAALFSMARPARIAAFATVGSNAAEVRWSCAGSPPPAAVIYRACDTITPCADVEQWLGSRERDHAPTLSLRLDAGHRAAPSCALHKRSCRDNNGRVNHARWPRARDKDILEYLARYSLR